MNFRAIITRFAAACAVCGHSHSKGANVLYYRDTKQITCIDCYLEDGSVNVNTMPDPGMIDAENFTANNL